MTGGLSKGGLSSLFFGRGRGPLAIAAFLAIPLFFCSLMASSLAQDTPHVIAWKGCHSGLCRTWHQPTTANVAAVWLWAFVPSLVLVAVGLVARRLPLGWYVSCVASIVIAMGVAHKTATWAHHHRARYPMGVDLIPSSNHFSDQWSPGEWESEARETALSLQHWTIGIALAAMLVMAFLWVRGRYFSRRPAVTGVPGEAIHAPDATMPGL